MKVIAILEHTITGGGGFNQALNAIIQMKSLCEGRFEFEVFSTDPDNQIHLEKLGISSVTFSYSLIDKLLAKLGINPFWQTIQSRIKFIGSFEKKLLKHKCDLVYFTTPSGYVSSLQRLNYITTIWDNCHRDTPEFPEVRNFNQFLIRERNNISVLASAFIIIVDSISLADSISKRYGVDRSRLLSMPFAPSPLLSSGSPLNKKEVMAKHNLEEGYFFYPAQFWSHKNHIRILEALILLNEKGQTYKVVFAGGDQGNKKYCEQFVKDNKMLDQVYFLGFVSSDDMQGLYEGCRAVIMPSYFGPTNLPPLEAWSYKKPLIYSSRFNEQAKDAAVLVDPDDASQLASAIVTCMDKDHCNKLIKSGLVRLNQLNREREISESELFMRLQTFSKRLNCWDRKIKP